MDQMGEVEYAPGEPKGTSWHPHRGFETVTYIIDGTFEHADSHGGGGTISNGDTQWMTAGGGVLHIERPPEHLVVSGGLFHGLQLWVNLPKAQKWVEPRYQDLRADESVLLASPDAGAFLRVIAGDVAGQTGPGSTYTPMAMVHATVSPGATLDLPWRPDFNALVYVLSGAGSVGIDGAPGPHRPARRLRPRRHDHHQRRRPPGVADAGARRRDPRRRADPRADRHVRAVRDEHPPGGHGRVHRLPGRPARLDPGAGTTFRTGPSGARLARTPRRGLMAIRPSGGRTAMSNLDTRPAAQELGGLETSAGPALDLLPGKEVLLGESTRVRRLLPTLGRRLVGAWAFVDHYGPDDVAAGAGMQVAPHPHTGLQTVSWLLEGEVHHRDSLGSDVQFGPASWR